MSNSQEDCFAYLEQLRWNGKPRCPYCESTNATSIKKEHRYHCNQCFSSFSVTVGTLFHKTHIDLRTWFRAIALVLNPQRDVSVRQLAKEVGVNKNTASYMISRINKAIHEEPEFIKKLVEHCRSWDREE